jgi:hypothetical protein
MRDYLTGILILFTVALVCYQVNRFTLPYSHFSFLEWIGIVMIGVIIKTGFDTYREE